jgi:Protein of unknown function (DUF3089)
MIMKNLCKLVVVILSVLALLPGCSKSKSTDDLSTTSIDYSQAKYWLNRPSTSQLDKPVDVFYVYPSVYVKSANGPIYSTIDNSAMVEGAKVMYQKQATVFDLSANIFAPYYRQADAFTVLSSKIHVQDSLIGGIPTTDVVNAFKYYIKNLNNGRPFILAGHSQGSNVLLNLLSDSLMKNTDVYRRMIAAYIIGFGVTKNYLQQNPHLKFATAADDYGVIVSYNTEDDTITVPNPVVRPESIAINPLTWTTDETPADASLNLGGVWFDNTGTQIGYPFYPPQSNPGNANARVNKNRGSLMCSNYDAIQDSILVGTHFPMGVYHLFDYSFYYYNLRENAVLRTYTYFRINK